MSPGNEIRIWHSLALKCKRGVLALPEQFIIKATEFLLNIHEVQWIITGLAIITNFSKCTDKRVKYIIFPCITQMDDLNGFLKLGVSYFLWICVILCPILHNTTVFTFCSLFWWRENGSARTERRSEKCHLLVFECFSTALIHLCQQHVSAFLFSSPSTSLKGVLWFTCRLHFSNAKVTWNKTRKYIYIFLYDFTTFGEKKSLMIKNCFCQSPILKSAVADEWNNTQWY